jgi:hypothetical protein
VIDVSTLDLPEFDPTDVTLHGERFHQVMTELAATSWIARAPLGYLTLDRAAGEFFLRSKNATFPGQLIAELSGVTDGPLREEIDHNILHLDGDRHRRLRNLLNPFFTPRASDRWRPVMRELIEKIYADIAGAGGCDFVEAVAKPYPSQTIATVMGAPLDDAPRLHEWSHWMQSQFDGVALLEHRDRIQSAVTDFYEWCDALIARRRSDPADDLISVLIAAEAEGDRLDDSELRNLVPTSLPAVSTRRMPSSRMPRGCSPSTPISGRCWPSSRSSRRALSRRCCGTSRSRRSPRACSRPTSPTVTTPSRRAPSSSSAPSPATATAPATRHSTSPPIEATPA